MTNPMSSDGGSPLAALRYEGVWRNPGEESVDLYPGLTVHDGRNAGSINIGRTRLPLWAICGTAIRGSWAEVEDGWEPSEYGFTANDFASFIYNLLEARGEFGRLLLVLANARRAEGERESAWVERIRVPGQYELKAPADDPEPGSWWEHADLRDAVKAQLRSCLAALDGA